MSIQLTDRRDEPLFAAVKFVQLAGGTRQSMCRAVQGVGAQVPQVFANMSQ